MAFIQPYGGEGNRRSFSPEGMQKATAAGGTRGGPRGAGALSGRMVEAAQASRQASASDKATANRNNDLGYQIDRFQREAREGVKGYGRMLGKDLQREIGTMLGGLNGIGALRSGAVQANARDLMDAFGRRVGDYASMTTMGALQMAQAEKAAESDRRFRTKLRQDMKSASRSQMIGQMLGGAVGLGTRLIPGLGAMGAAGIPTAPIASPDFVPIRGDIPLR